MTSLRWTSGARIWEPTTTCCLTCSNSASVRGPCLFRISSRMPTLPMSCSRPSVRIASTASSLHPIWAATLAERSAIRAEWPRRWGSLASRALTSASSVATEMRCCAACSQPPFRHPERDLFLERLIDLLALQHGAPAPQGVLDGPAQHREVDRLDQVVQGATLHAEGRAGGVVDGREHNEREVGLQLQHPWHQVDAAEPGEIHVQQHSGDFASLQQTERLVPRGRCRDLVSLVHEILPDRAPDGLLVVHDHQRHRTVWEGHTHSYRGAGPRGGPALTRRTGWLRETGS